MKNENDCVFNIFFREFCICQQIEDYGRNFEGKGKNSFSNLCGYRRKNEVIVWVLSCIFFNKIVKKFNCGINLVNVCCVI